MQKNKSDRISTETIEGHIAIHKQKSNYWSVCYINDIAAVGTISPEITNGNYVRATGHYVHHNVYGKQFNIETCHNDVPSSLEGIRSYLIETFKWIGPSTADNIIETFQDKFFDLIENNPDEVVQKIRGITHKRIEDIKQTWEESKRSYELDLFFYKCGISPRLMVKIYDSFIPYKYFDEYKDLGKIPIEVREGVVEQVRDNPYILADKIDGIGFIKADQIAQALGIPQNSPFRTQAAVKYCIKQESFENGHCFIYNSDLINGTLKILKTDNKLGVILEIKNLINNEELIVVDENKMYLKYFYNVEKYIGQKINSILSEKTFIPFKPPESCKYWEDLTDEQKNAVINATQNNITIITGPPGTGKTFTLKAILECFSGVNVIAMAAPTGKAAKRMNEQTGFPASTIHRLLQYNRDGMFDYNENNPLKCDVLILDESSMIDISLMYSLCLALDNMTKIIFVGDIDQLPSVGAGQVFRDLINCGKIYVTYLTKIMRQDETSNIVKTAWNINHGEDILRSNMNGFYYSKHSEDIEQVETIKKSVDWLMKEKNLKLDDIQVLCPMKKGNVGVEELNKMFSNIYNPNGILISTKDFKTGDKIIQKKNYYRRVLFNYNRFWNQHIELGIYQNSVPIFFSEEDKRYVSYGVFNGENGTIIDFDRDKQILFVKYEDKFTCYTIDQAHEEIMLSYVLTIHKSQGSEYDAVIVPLHKSAYIMLQRNLLYTAITRAKKYCILISDDKTVYLAINRNESKNRNTSLKEIIKQNIGEDNERSNTNIN